MSDEFKMPHFFLGANSPCGFISYFEQLYHLGDGWHLYILKGGPGTGKSTLMKRIASYALAREYPVEFIHCPSSPESLDAVILPAQRVCIADGTSPHILEAKYPGVSETLIDLGTCWNSRLLREKSENIIFLTDQCRKAHEYSQSLCQTAGQLLQTNKRLASQCINREKLHHTIQRYQKKLPKLATGGYGKENFRFLSAITPNGLTSFPESVSENAETIILLEDEYGAVAPEFLDGIRKDALEKGYSVISLPSPLSLDNSLEGLLIPEANVGFLTMNSWHPYHFPSAKTIHAKRFLSQEYPLYTQRLRFGRKIARELLRSASLYLNKADLLHNELESCYVKAMDFSKTEVLYHMLRGVLFEHTLMIDPMGNCQFV